MRENFHYPAPPQEGKVPKIMNLSGKLNELAKEVHENAVAHGFWKMDVSADNEGNLSHTYTRDFGEIVANIHSEVSEMWDDYTNHRGMTEIYYEDKGFKPGFNVFDHSIFNGLSIGNCSCGQSLPCPTKEAARLKKPCGIPIEAADILIRLIDMCAAYGIDIEDAIEAKADYNKSREFMHGKRA